MSESFEYVGRGEQIMWLRKTQTSCYFSLDCLLAVKYGEFIIIKVIIAYSIHDSYMELGRHV